MFRRKISKNGRDGGYKVCFPKLVGDSFPTEYAIVIVKDDHLEIWPDIETPEKCFNVRKIQRTFGTMGE
jgi:hypothetical protein